MTITNNRKGENSKTNNKTSPSKIKLPVEKLIIEFFSIVLGVMLALGLNQWRENRQYENKATVALEKVHNEIIANLNLIKAVNENNKETLKEIELMMEADSVVQNDFIPGVQISGNAWNALLNADVAGYIDYNILDRLSELYSIQDVYMKMGYILIESMLNINSISIGMNTDIDQEKLATEMYDYFQTINNIEGVLMNLLEENSRLLSE